MNYTKTNKTRPRLLKVISPLHKAGRQLSLFLGAKFRDTELSGAEAHILTYLQAYAPCPIAELIRVFGHKKPTMTSILDRLEKKQFIKRTLNPDDRRSFIVTTTARGDKAALEARRCVDQLDARIVRRTSKADLDAFHRVMAIIGEVTGVEVRPGTTSTPSANKEK